LLNISPELEGFWVVPGGDIGDPGVIGVEGLALKILPPPVEHLLELEDLEPREGTIGRSGVFGTAFRPGGERAGVSI